MCGPLLIYLLSPLCSQSPIILMCLIYYFYADVLEKCVLFSAHVFLIYVNGVNIFRSVSLVNQHYVFNIILGG